MKKIAFSEYIKSFDFKTLFNELGWDNFNNSSQIIVDDELYTLEGISEKRGFALLQCRHTQSGEIPLSNIRKRIESQIEKLYHEHIIIYTDKDQTRQIWQFTLKEENKPKQVREITWHSHQDTDVLFQRTKNLIFTLAEDDEITIVDVMQRVSENFAKNTEKVTKQFYT
ncbi:MAG: hypothetical protein KAH48_12730, partial [Chlorobi bacterium]|nr:hypothetical protein [Chlorobiota bacterium]